MRFYKCFAADSVFFSAGGYKPFAALVIIFCTIFPGASSAAEGVLKRVEGFSRAYAVKVPDSYSFSPPELMRLEEEGITVDLYARDFEQGNLVYAELYRSGGQGPVKGAKLYCGSREIPLTHREWGSRGFIPISPEAEPGSMQIRLVYSFGWFSREITGRFIVREASFPHSRKALNLGKFSDSDYHTKKDNLEHIKRSSAKKKKAFASRGPDMISSSLSHPRDMHYITSEFWAKRTYRRYRTVKGVKKRLKDKVSIHRGLDLRGFEGTPVYAMARGRVVLADFLFYEGNMVVIDHGNGIFTYYMHLKTLNAAEGDVVDAGDVIAAVGSTGQSTAAHLHVSLYAGGEQVDPLSLLHLPVRD